MKREPEFVEYLLFKPIIEGLATLKEFQDGTYTLLDVYKLHEIMLQRDKMKGGL